MHIFFHWKINKIFFTKISRFFINFKIDEVIMDITAH